MKEGLSNNTRKAAVIIQGSNRLNCSGKLVYTLEINQLTRMSVLLPTITKNSAYAPRY